AEPRIGAAPLFRAARKAAWERKTEKPGTELPNGHSVLCFSPAMYGLRHAFFGPFRVRPRLFALVFPHAGNHGVQIFKVLHAAAHAAQRRGAPQAVQVPRGVAARLAHANIFALVFTQ